MPFLLQCVKSLKTYTQHGKSVLILILMIMFMVLSSWRGHCKSSPSSFDECRLSARWPPTLKPSQPTSPVSLPVGCYHPHPSSPFISIRGCAPSVPFLPPFSVRSISPCTAYEPAVANLCVVCGHHSHGFIAVRALTQTARRTTGPSSGRPFYMNRRPSYPASRGTSTWEAEMFSGCCCWSLSAAAAVTTCRNWLPVTTPRQQGQLNRR